MSKNPSQHEREHQKNGDNASVPESRRKAIFNVFISAILAGFSIGLGGLVFLSVESKTLGAALFTIGLFTICTSGFHLYTGKICYALQNGKEYLLNLPVIWIGNLAGTGTAAFFAGMTRNGSMLSEKAAALCQTKVNDDLLSLFFLGIICNCCIYIAVEGFRSIRQDVGKYLALFFGVMVFILAGTEHCVADMFYFWIGKAWSGRAVISILVITAGNSVGGLFIPLLRKAGS